MGPHWAEKKKMQTLSTVMGPLMLKEHSACLKMSKTPSQWSNYVRGASGLFAQHISRAPCVTVLTRPPQTLNPLGASTYQQIEEPLLKGSYGGFHVLRIDMVHPTVIGAENFRYQVWPVDETEKWIAVFGYSPPLKRRLNDTRVLYLPPSLTHFSASTTEPHHPSCVNGEKKETASNHPKQEMGKQGQKQKEQKPGKKKTKQEKLKQETTKQKTTRQRKTKKDKAKQHKSKTQKAKAKKAK
ncbi:hypothetical protein LTR84_012061 [Exophiala bonariae]|uniref:Uncharacterized protein n=1 Tax=Exophiala bonariae TaxID=1690606 RepID=A0AAV9NIT2_9EURO|nr:hypothetical protein LTR84_012061 [Exophiala bonariae]